METDKLMVYVSAVRVVCVYYVSGKVAFASEPITRLVCVSACDGTSVSQTDIFMFYFAYVCVCVCRVRSISAGLCAQHAPHMQAALMTLTTNASWEELECTIVLYRLRTRTHVHSYM